MFVRKKYVLIIFIIFILIYNNRLYAVKNSYLRWGYCVDYISYPENYLNKVINNYDILCLTGFKIDSNANIFFPPQNKYLKIYNLCKKRNKIFVPLISFSTIKNGEKILKKEILRKKVINNLKKIVQKEKFSMIHFDLEYYSADYTRDLALLFRQLKLNINVTLTMAIFPQIDFPQRISRFHNLDILGPYLDEIVLMCYDYHNKTDTPGPVTDINWCIKNINFIKSSIDCKNIYLGIPAYGYIWSSDNKIKVISSRKGREIVKNRNYIRHKSGCVYYSFSRRKIKYQLYFPDMYTIQKLERLAGRYNLKGVALWRLGFE